MAKRKSKEKQMSVVKQSDPMESLIFRSEANAVKGIGPKNKKSQDNVFDIIGEKEVLEVVDSSGKKTNPHDKNGHIEWDQIKDMPKTYNLMNKPVEQWSVRQLFVHFRSLFYNRYGCEIVDVGDLSAYEVIRKMREEFGKLTEKSRVNSVFIKKYMEWYVDNALDSVIAKKGGFRIHAIRTKSAMLRFLKEYVEEKVSTDTLPVTTLTTSANDGFTDIDKIYSTNKITFLTKFGVVIGLNWLIIKKGFSTDKSKKIIIDLLEDAKKEGDSVMNQISKSTFVLAPYSKHYNVEGIEEILSMVNMVGVQFSSTAKVHF